MTNKEARQKYWQKNIYYLLILLTVWFICSFGLGLLWVDELNSIKMGGFKLGFWFAQQGAIYTFVIIIFIYVYLMNKLDSKYNSNQKDKE